MVVCLGLIAGSIFAIIRFLGHKPGTPQQQMFRTIQSVAGRVAVEQVIKLVGQAGQVVVVRLDTTNLPSQQDTVVETFLAELGKHKSFTVVGTELVDPAPILETGQFGWPAATLTKILSEHGDATVIVSFVGAPKLTDAEIASLPAQRPKIVAVSSLSYQVDFRHLMDKQVIHAAIVPPTGDQRLAATANPKTDRDWFDHYLTVVTPETAPAPAP